MTLINADERDIQAVQFTQLPTYPFTHFFDSRLLFFLLQDSSGFTIKHPKRDKAKSQEPRAK